MSSTTATYFNAPPPTFNTLDTCQRTRLIRTTRKLGAVLGTTPHLVEDDSGESPYTSPDAHKAFSPKRDRKRRQGSIFEFPPSTSFIYDYSSSASSSVSSLALSRSSIDSERSEAHIQPLPAPKSFARHVREKSKSKGKCTPLPTPLVLRLNAVPLPPSDPRLQAPVTPDTGATLRSAGLTVATPFTMPVTPTTPRTPSTPTVTETRRKRLAKLKRTLGENVPVELIMPFRSTRIRSPSHATSSPLPLPHAQYGPPHSPQVSTPTLEGAKTAPRREKTSTLPRMAKGTRRRSLSVDYINGVMTPALTSSGSEPEHLPRSFRSQSPSSPFPPVSYSHSATHSRESPYSPERRSSRVWVTGTGTWTGEWNRRDIREVQSQLRNLRAR